MAKSESDIFTPRTGQVIQTENGTQYFVCGNNRIKIAEHFAAAGQPLGDLIVDVVRHTAEKAVSAWRSTVAIRPRLWYNCTRAKVL